MSINHSYTDHELISLLKEGNHEAYTEIYNRYAGLLYIHACKKIRDPEIAKDIIQELFTSIWNNRETLEIKSHLAGYLYTAVRYQVIKWISRKSLEDKYVASMNDTLTNGSIETDYQVRENQLGLLIENGIDALPPKMRHIFSMSRKQYLSHKEIACQLEISESTVKKQVNNALKILRLKLGTFK